MTKTAKKAKPKKDYTALAAQLGAAVLLCLYPLFLADRYYKMTYAKMVFFCVCSFALICVLGMVMLSTENKLRNKLTLKAPHELSLLTFAGLGVIGCVFSGDPAAAFTGAEGRHMGLLTVIAMALAYLTLSEFFVFTDWVVYAFAGASVCVNGIAVIQLAGGNPFGLYTDAVDSTVYNFVSTIGNINVFSSFLCLVIPFFLYLSLQTSDRVKKCVYSVTLLFAFLGSFAAKSDGIYLGLAGVLLVMTWTVRKSRTAQTSLFHAAVLFFTADLITALIAEFILHSAVPLTFLSRLLVNYKVCVPLLLLSVGLYLISRYAKIPEKAAQIFFTVIFALGIAAAAGAFCLLIYFSVLNKNTELGSFAKYFRFNDDWGTHRGYIWRTVSETFGAMPFFNKLFGCGEDRLLGTITNLLGEERSFYQENGGISLIDNAHNEFLHVLATHGLLGLLSYLGFLFHSFRKALSSASPFKKAALFSAFGYLLQAFVNLWQPITTPLLFVFLALSVSAETED